MNEPDFRPVLKWAGGKSRLLPHILRRFPEEVGTYYEPFVGGAAVFFALSRERRFRRAVLSDRNPALVGVYQALKKNAEAVISVLREYVYDREHYYRVRAMDPAGLDLFERAARIIYLNKTGYNGLYRENSRGEFNVPFGRYKDPRFCDPENLRAAQRALAKTKLEVGDFEEASESAKRGDAVYFDPPYDPVSKTASFTAYHKTEFGKEDHKRLAKAFDTLGRRGVSVVLSNSHTEFTSGLFSKFDMERVAVSRPINSRANGRGAIHEILVTHRRGR